jgi:hypothetical protein
VTPQIATRAYELYEQRGRSDGHCRKIEMRLQRLTIFRLYCVRG